MSKQGQTIVIEPADPEVVYVPEYDPWLVYGAPIGIWPGWYSYPGLYLAGPGIAFGFGFGIGFFGGFGWGWHTGDTIGITTGSFSTTTPTSPTAEFSSTATTSIAPVDFMGGGFHGGSRGFRGSDRSMDSRHRMPRPARIPELSAASIMEEWREAFPLAGSRASAEASTVAELSTAVEVSTEAAAVEGNSVQLPQTRLMIWRKNSCAQTI